MKRMMSTTFRCKRSIAVFVAAATLVGAIVVGCKQRERTAAAKKPTSKEALLSEGKALYYRRDCVKCHGFRGDGKAVSGLLLSGKPRDFADLAAYKQGATAEAIARTLQVGVAGKKTAMPAYPYLSDRERLALATYVIELRERRQNSK